MEELCHPSLDPLPVLPPPFRQDVSLQDKDDKPATDLHAPNFIRIAGTGSSGM